MFTPVLTGTSAKFLDRATNQRVVLRSISRQRVCDNNELAVRVQMQQRCKVARRKKDWQSCPCASVVHGLSQLVSLFRRHPGHSHICNVTGPNPQSQLYLGSSICVVALVDREALRNHSALTQSASAVAEHHPGNSGQALYNELLDASSSQRALASASRWATQSSKRYCMERRTQQQCMLLPE